jgi:hypothetical protein
MKKFAVVLIALFIGSEAHAQLNNLTALLFNRENNARLEQQRQRRAQQQQTRRTQRPELRHCEVARGANAYYFSNGRLINSSRQIVSGMPALTYTVNYRPWRGSRYWMELQQALARPHTLTEGEQVEVDCVRPGAQPSCQRAEAGVIQSIRRVGSEYYVKASRCPYMVNAQYVTNLSDPRGATVQRERRGRQQRQQQTGTRTRT